MSDSTQWLRDRLAYHVISLELLSHKPFDARMTCPLCHDANARSQELCACGGTCTVAEAMAFHRDELAMLGAPAEAVGTEAVE